MWCTMSHKGCQSNSSADPDRPLAAAGGLKIGEIVFPTSLKAQFQEILSFSILSNYQNQVPEGLSNIDIVFILSRIPNPILLSLLLETSSHCRLTADIVVIHPFPILAPPPLPLLDRSNDDTWKAEGGFCGADSESTMTHWSTGSSLRSSSCSRDDRSGQDGEREVPQSQGESQPWAGDGQRSIHNVWMITFTSTSSSPVKGKDLQWISSIILFHFFRVHPDYQRWTSCFLHLSSQSSCAFALTPAHVLSSFLPLL